jgi:hypothetical protein
MVCPLNYKTSVQQVFIISTSRKDEPEQYFIEHLPENLYDKLPEGRADAAVSTRFR